MSSASNGGIMPDELREAVNLAEALTKRDGWLSSYTAREILLARVLLEQQRLLREIAYCGGAVNESVEIKQRRIARSGLADTSPFPKPTMVEIGVTEDHAWQQMEEDSGV